MSTTRGTTPDGRPFRRGLTRRGWALGVVGALASAVGLVGGGDGWQRVGLLLLGLLGLSLLVVLRTRVGLHAGRGVDPARVPVDSETVVHLDVASNTFVPGGMLRLEDTVPGSGSAGPRFVIDRGGARWSRRITYRLRPRHRGLLRVGPLRVYVEDPFGLVVSRRTLAESTTVVVTPQVVPLPAIRIPGEWSGSGESRPRSIAAAGEEDVTVRPYQRGDDRRRVHWRASARHSQLMVRREEQPWQSRATLVLDNRLAAHSRRVPGRQTPAKSSLEWAVSAAASIGTHLLARGYAVRLVTDEGGATSTAWHDRSEGSGAAEGLLLEALATVSPAAEASIGRIRSMLHGGGTSSGMLVAVLGSLTGHEAATLARLRHDTSSALAVLLDVDGWPGGGESVPDAVGVEVAAQTLRRAGWHCVVVGADEHDAAAVAAVWTRLGEARRSGGGTSSSGAVGNGAWAGPSAQAPPVQASSERVGATAPAASGSATA